MQYETYHYIFIGSAILAAILFLVSLFLFFYLRIPGIIGDLTGRNAQKGIADIEGRGRRNGKKKTQSYAAASQAAARKAQKQTGMESDMGKTVMLEETEDGKTTILEETDAGKTAALEETDVDKTTVLQGEEKDGLFEIEEDIYMTDSAEVVV